MNERLEILLQSGVISARTVEEVMAIDRELFGARLIEAAEAKEAAEATDVAEATAATATMFLVHLAMTIERAHKGEPITDVDPGIREEVLARPETEKNRALVARMEEIIAEELSEAERIYLLLHIGTWTEKEGE